MRKLAVALSKGGVGKTTTAVNLAHALARIGKRVLLIDVDTQGQVATALGMQPPFSLADWITGERSPEQVVVLARENLWLAAGGRSLAGLKQMIARKEFGGERTLAEVLEPLDDSYDFILLDTSPGWDPLVVNVLFYAYEILSPVSLEVMTLQGLMDFSRSLSAIQRYRPSLSLRYVVPTFFDRRVRKSKEIMDQLEAYFTDQLCDPVRYNVRLSECPGYGQTIFEYAPGSAGAQDYMHLSERILQDGRA